MIWQERVTTIVMVTNLKEGEKVRLFAAHPYKNNAESVTHFMVGNISKSLIYS